MEAPNPNPLLSLGCYIATITNNTDRNMNVAIKNNENKTKKDLFIKKGQSIFADIFIPAEEFVPKNATLSSYNALQGICHISFDDLNPVKAQPVIWFAICTEISKLIVSKAYKVIPSNSTERIIDWESHSSCHFELLPNEGIFKSNLEINQHDALTNVHTVQPLLYKKLFTQKQLTELLEKHNDSNNTPGVPKEVITLPFLPEKSLYIPYGYRETQIPANQKMYYTYKLEPKKTESQKSNCLIQ